VLYSSYRYKLKSKTLLYIIQCYCRYYSFSYYVRSCD